MQLVRPTSTRIRLIRVALLVTVAIGLGAFLFAAYIGSTIWWLNHSPWNSTGKGAQFMLIPYKALVKRQPKVKPTGYATPTLMPSYYTFRVSFQALSSTSKADGRTRLLMCAFDTAQRSRSHTERLTCLQACRL